MRTLRRFVDSDELSSGVQRIGTAAVGLLLWWFGVVAFGDHGRFFTTQPAPAPSIGGNGLLAALCLLCGACLIVAAIRGGMPTVSAATAVGLVYLVLGVASLFVLGSAANVFAVTLPDSLLGLVAGFVLLALGTMARQPVAIVSNWRSRRPELPKQRGAA
jgi:hypothetical protein